jgi:hypothetical protein
MRDIRNCFARHNGGAAQELVPRHNHQRHRNVNQSTFAYDGRFWEIPKDFEFLCQVILNTGWRLWLLGQDIGNEQTTLRVKPFCKLTLSNLPNKKPKDTFKLKWLPVFKMMEQAENLNLPNDTSSMSASDINQSFKKCWD